MAQPWIWDRLHPEPGSPGITNRKGTLVMTKALVKLQSKLRKEDGATAVEYGLMVALIAIVIIVAVAALGKNLSNLFSVAANSV